MTTFGATLRALAEVIAALDAAPCLLPTLATRSADNADHDRHDADALDRERVVRHSETHLADAQLLVRRGEKPIALRRVLLLDSLKLGIVRILAQPFL